MGREFIDIFDEWIHVYDATVAGEDPEYRDVFNKYDEILNAVAQKVIGTVLEFGTGTGNLTTKLIDAGHQVIGIEPNRVARQLTQKRFPSIPIKDGDLLDFETDGLQIHTVTSSYVFHHLTNEEKGIALKKYAELLPTGGKIIFADTVFSSDQALQDQIAKERARGFHVVADDLEREYYTTIPVIRDLFTEAGFQVTFEKMNDYVWLMDASKQ
ncbi:bifunctional 2-polyprenyl-6-hydroxyphenol methylase/3-demethylubiquinol 3-O-methyltransferase UbiG [Sporosarcina sp. HYO08]|uniref:class I SAM-dependent methyltransferase n=1 Tax=Sporosarcina sp. HYO08 TaxID=1759557 RepID=UPI00079846E6|nr:class I SAM-dependent methyltransferase [Sporosarcina sp. HYO08]KXH81753.1 SAM-dependent methyltransferase [Sporosarcina sp. HYO08]